MKFGRLLLLSIVLLGAIVEIDARGGGGGFGGGHGGGGFGGGHSFGGGFGGGRGFEGGSFAGGRGYSGYGYGGGLRTGGISTYRGGATYARPTYAGMSTGMIGTRTGTIKSSGLSARTGVGATQKSAIGSAARPVNIDSKAGMVGRTGMAKSGIGQAGVKTGAARLGGTTKQGTRAGMPTKPGKLSPNKTFKTDANRNPQRLNQQKNFMNRRFDRTHDFNRLYNGNFPLFMSLFPFAFFNAYGYYPPIYYDFFDDNGYYPEENPYYDDYASGEMPIDYGPIFEEGPEEMGYVAPESEEGYTEIAGTTQPPADCGVACGTECMARCIKNSGQDVETCKSQCHDICDQQCSAMAAAAA